MTTHARRFITLSLVLAVLVLMAGCSHGTEDGESPYVATPEDAPSEDPIQHERNEDNFILSKLGEWILTPEFPVESI